MPLDLSYWLDENDSDIAFAAHGFKERNAYSKISTYPGLGNVCISQTTTANNALSAIKSSESDIGKYIAELYPFFQTTTPF